MRSTQLGLALGGYETAVEALRAKAWPEAPLARAAVELYDAHALLGYLDAYGWEIGQRERVVGGEKLDLKLWTRDQIAAEADRAFAPRLGAARSARHGSERLVRSPRPEQLSRPRSVRRCATPSPTSGPTGLADSSGWSPEELQELWKLDLAALVGRHRGRADAGAAERRVAPSAGQALRRSSATSSGGIAPRASAAPRSKRGSSGCGSCSTPSPPTRIARGSAPRSPTRSPSSAPSRGGGWAWRASRRSGDRAANPRR